jgi:hypothetical protein
MKSKLRAGSVQVNLRTQQSFEYLFLKLFTSHTWGRSVNVYVETFLVSWVNCTHKVVLVFILLAARQVASYYDGLQLHRLIPESCWTFSVVDTIEALYKKHTIATCATLFILRVYNDRVLCFTFMGLPPLAT